MGAVEDFLRADGEYILSYHDAQVLSEELAGVQMDGFSPEDRAKIDEYISLALNMDSVSQSLRFRLDAQLVILRKK